MADYVTLSCARGASTWGADGTSGSRVCVGQHDDGHDPAILCTPDAGGYQATVQGDRRVSNTRVPGLLRYHHGSLLVLA